MGAPNSLSQWKAEVAACTRCHEFGLLHNSPRVAAPLVSPADVAAIGVVIVAEAPNDADTYDPSKGYLTYDDPDDPTGSFLRSMLIEEVGLSEEEYEGIVFTNAALCLPVRRGERHPVTARQTKLCSPWLRRLIEDSSANIVVTLGGKALHAMRQIERHQFRLREHAGRPQGWWGRTLLPLYHPGRLGRLNRSEAEQRRDIQPLRELIRSRAR